MRLSNAIFIRAINALLLYSEVKIMYRLRALALIAALWAAVPLMLLTAWWQKRGLQPHRSMRGGVALVTGLHMGKALQISRHLYAAGYTVIGVDFPEWWMAAGRFSNSLAAFHLIPKEQYLQSILRIVIMHGVGLVVPVAEPGLSALDSELASRLPPGCRTLAVSSVLHSLLDDKHRFAQLCSTLGLRTPHTIRITSSAQVLDMASSLRGRYLLKRIRYSAAARYDGLQLPCSAAEAQAHCAKWHISAQDPWVAQELAFAPEYSTYSIAHKGRLVAHADSLASISTKAFQPLNSSDIRHWVQTFCQRTRLDGQVCFDFMRDSLGRLCAIECNPRCSAVVNNLRDEANFARALTDPGSLTTAVEPFHSQSSRLWPVELCTRPWAVLATRDAYLAPHDWLPFLAVYALQVPVQLFRRIWDGKPWGHVNWNVGKVPSLSEP